MRWVEVAEAAAGAVVAPVGAADVGRDVWVALLLPVRAATVSALTAVTKPSIRPTNRATR